MSSLDGWGRFCLTGLRGCHFAIHYLLQSHHVAVSLMGQNSCPFSLLSLVNKLTINWNVIAKYIDDVTIVEIIQRYSFSMLPIVASEISTFAAEHGIRLNGPKCKDMLIEFLRYKPFQTPPLYINAHRAGFSLSTHKLLGVYFASDLSWSYHCKCIVKRAHKSLNAWRVLVKSGPIKSRGIASVL